MLQREGKASADVGTAGEVEDVRGQSSIHSELEEPHKEAARAVQDQLEAIEPIILNELKSNKVFIE